jgi:hypothetical protein
MPWTHSSLPGATRRLTMIFGSIALTAICALAILCGRAEASKIVYSCEANLCAVDPESGVSSAITGDGASSSYRYPSISSDGDTVAAVRGNDVVVGRYGANLTAVWGGSRDMNDLAISPDGSAFGESHAYVESRYGCPFTGGCLELVDASRTFFQVGPDPAAVFESYPGGGGVGFLGRGSLLSSDYTLSTSTHAICVVGDPAAPDSTCEPRIVSAKTLSSPAGSADGKLIAVTVSDEAGGSSISLHDAASGAQLRQLAAQGSGPAFSPDATKVAYSGPDGWIHVVPTRGGKAQRLVKGISPSWGGGLGPGPAIVSPKARYRNGRITLKLSCGGSAPCRGTLRIKQGKTSLGARSFRLKPGRKGSVAVVPSRAGSDKLAQSFPRRIVVQLKPAKGKLVTKRLPLRR